MEFFGAVSRQLGDQFPLSSYLIKPFQRMTKYKQFLADLVKHFSASDLKDDERDHFDKLQVPIFDSVTIILKYHGMYYISYVCSMHSRLLILLFVMAMTFLH